VTPLKDSHQAAELARRCYPIFASEDPTLVGAALCELVALLLAGHFVAGDPAGTQALRDEMLALHIETVKNLVPVMEQIRTGPMLKARMQ
jgi:hypothetical protein